MTQADRRQDAPMMMSEWRRWLKDEFGPRSDQESVQERKLERVVQCLFGDGNGNAGLEKDVKSLMETAHRIECGIDTLGWLWKAITAVLFATAAGAALGKSLGWW